MFCKKGNFALLVNLSLFFIPSHNKVRSNCFLLHISLKVIWTYYGTVNKVSDVIDISAPSPQISHRREEADEGDHFFCLWSTFLLWSTKKFLAYNWKQYNDRFHRLYFKWENSKPLAKLNIQKNACWPGAFRYHP